MVQFKEVFLTPEYLAIAMEYAAGGDMFQYVKQRGGLEEAEARWFFQQLIIGMDYCHKMVRAQGQVGAAAAITIMRRTACKRKWLRDVIVTRLAFAYCELLMRRYVLI